jgi:hypothetical protein
MPSLVVGEPAGHVRVVVGAPAQRFNRQDGHARRYGSVRAATAIGVRVVFVEFTQRSTSSCSSCSSCFVLFVTRTVDTRTRRAVVLRTTHWLLFQKIVQLRQSPLLRFICFFTLQLIQLLCTIECD